MSYKYQIKSDYEWVHYERRHDQCYRANPKNRHHDVYQRVVTRRIFAAICLLLLYAASTTYTPLDIIFTFGMVVCGIIVLIAALSLIVAIVRGLFRWLSGE